MTELRTKMREVIQSGIDGWLDAVFSGGQQPLDPSGYPLTRDRTAVFYRSGKPYQTIEDEFLEGIAVEIKSESKFFQAWSNYHWNFAHLELGEVFEPVTLELTPDILERRQQMREELYSNGYKLAIKEQ